MKVIYFISVFFLFLLSCKTTNKEHSQAKSHAQYDYGITNATYRCYGDVNSASCMVQSRDPVHCGYGTGHIWINADPGNKINVGISNDIINTGGTSECGQCLYIEGINGSAYVMVTDKGHVAGSGRVENDTIDIDNEVYQQISGERDKGGNEMTTHFTDSNLGWKHPLSSVRKVDCAELFDDHRVIYAILNESGGTTDFNIRRGKTSIAEVYMRMDQSSSWERLTWDWGATYRWHKGYQNGLSKNRDIFVKIVWKDGSQLLDQFYYDKGVNQQITGTNRWSGAQSAKTQTPSTGQNDLWEDPDSGNAIPYCQDTASDPDGDGWGWEANASCKIRK